LLAPTFSFDSSGARVVERKSDTRKRLRRSPDRADALLLTLAVDPPRAPGRPRPRGMRVFVSRGRIEGQPLPDVGGRRTDLALERESRRRGLPGAVGARTRADGPRVTTFGEWSRGISGGPIVRQLRRPRSSPVAREMRRVERMFRRDRVDGVLEEQYGIESWSVDRGRAELDEVLRRGGGR
jgi:hypothetical protein